MRNNLKAKRDGVSSGCSGCQQGLCYMSGVLSTFVQVEVQKLLKQNEYFERSIDEMETELKEAIQDADTSEKDAR